MKCSHLNSLDKGVLPIIVTSDEATSVANVGIVHFEWLRSFCYGVKP